MHIDLTDDKEFMLLSSPYEQEMTVITASLTTEIADAYILKKITSIQNTERKFINQYNMVPIGLWTCLLTTCSNCGIDVTFSDSMTEYLKSFTIDKTDFRAFINETFKNAKDDKGHDFIPYDYQVEAAEMLVKYRKCCGEISTSAGKTLISYVIFKYLYEVVGMKRMLYVVPSVDLGTQSLEKYEQYESFLNPCRFTKPWKGVVIMGQMKKKQKLLAETADIVFGTFQSLCKRSAEYLASFDIVLVDEAHHTTSSSIKNILTKAYNAKYAFGVTGTFPKANKKDSAYQALSIQCYIGPLVYHFTADRLINKEKKATPLYVVCQLLKWASQEEKQALWLLRKNKSKEDPTAGTKILNIEQKTINASYTRMKYVGDLAVNAKKNTLLLFGDIKYGYGKKLYEYIKETADRKNVYYVDGNTPPANREFIKEQFELDKEQKSVIVASMNTFGEGIDAKTVSLIIFETSTKSDRLARQIIGRGLRQYEGKNKCVVIDIVDDLRYTEDGTANYNYMYKHYLERKNIYIENKFPVYIQNISFDNGAGFT